MKHEQSKLSRGYRATLSKYLKQGSRANWQPAQALGRRAVVLGLETLDVARMHEAALVSLTNAGQPGLRKRAERFFAEAITPIE